MRARDLLIPYPTVLDSYGQPYALVTAAPLVGRLVPDFVRQDPLLAAVIGDRFDDDTRESAVGRPSAPGCHTNEQAFPAHDSAPPPSAPVPVMGHPVCGQRAGSPSLSKLRVRPMWARRAL